MPCLESEQLELLASGALDATQAEMLRAHLNGCEACRRKYGEHKADEDLLSKLRRLHGLGALRSDDVLPQSGGSVPDAFAGDSALPDAFPGYRIIRELHRGGQGVVYEAVQLATRRTVAVKVLLDAAFAGGQARWRFEREVRLIAALKHPNIIVIHDSGIACGRQYFAMDYVRGQPLDTHVRLSGLSTRDTVRLFARVCDAIAYAHRRGVIHRDLKPSNILVGEDGTPCVLDFGLAKVVGSELQETLAQQVSMPGNLMGTVAYMSPEQTFGDPDAIDTRTDVYSLGVILYELLTGSRPYPTGPDITAALQHIRQTDPRRPSRLRRELNSEIDAIVLKAMAKEPERRYQSAVGLLEDLQAWLEGRPVTARSDSALYVLRKIALRHTFQTTVAIALLGAIVSFGAITFHYYRQAAAALEQQTLSEDSARIAHQDMSKFLDEGWRALRQQDLGWFLLEWSEGRLDRAREIQAGVTQDSPEYAAMSFLLDETQSVADLQQKLPEAAEAMVHFVAGERYLKAGRVEQAMRAYEASAAAAVPPYERFGRSAGARLRQLRERSQAPAATPPAGTPNERGGP